MGPHCAIERAGLVVTPMPSSREVVLAEFEIDEDLVE
jgi:hypothetical protein